MTENENLTNPSNTKQTKTEKRNESFLYHSLGCIFALFLAFYPHFFIPHYSSSSGMGGTEKLSKSLLQSLQSSTAIYVAQQRVPPEVFSDFLVAEGESIGAATITLQNISDRLSDVKGVDTTQMTLTYSDHSQARYYLEGTDVTAEYEEYGPIAKKASVKQKKNALIKRKKKPETTPFQLTFNDILSKVKPVIFLAIPVIIIICFRKSWYFWGLLVFSVIIMFGSYFPRLTNLKPAIYLYPEKLTEVNVSLGKAIDITLDVPKYSSKKGWNVLANPDGNLVDLQPELTNCAELDTSRFGIEYAAKACKNNSYPYIYWEGINMFQPAPKSNKGWVVKQGEVAEFLNEKLDCIGFNDKEKRDFLEYWVQKIAALKQEEYFIYFLQTKELESYLPMTVSPQPDSVNRFYIVVSKAKPGQKPVPQELIKFKRKGFTLVDWGGSVLF